MYQQIVSRHKAAKKVISTKHHQIVCKKLCKFQTWRKLLPTGLMYLFLNIPFSEFTKKTSLELELMYIYKLPPDFVVFGDDLARSDGFAGEVATDLVVVVVNVVVDDDAVVIWRRLGRKSSPSLREITDEEDEELICWEDLENKIVVKLS